MFEPMGDTEADDDRTKQGLPGGLLHMMDFRGRSIPRPEEEEAET